MDGAGQPKDGCDGAWTSPEHPHSLPYLGVSLDDVVLDPTLGAELLLAQEAAVLAHRVVPLQDKSILLKPHGEPKIW